MARVLPVQERTRVVMKVLLNRKLLPDEIVITEMVGERTIDQEILSYQIILLTLNFTGG